MRLNLGYDATAFLPSNSLLARCFAASLLVPSFSVAQVNPSADPPFQNRAPLHVALEKLDSPDFNGAYAESISHAHAVQAIPGLERQFARATEPLDKAKYAQVLIRLGDRDDTYWNYLVRLATEALDSDAPDPTQGAPDSNKAFRAWARIHKLDPNKAAVDAVYSQPGIVGLLGLTGDKRAIPLLRRGLYSQNPLIVVMSAEGLEEVHDDASVPLIIASCRRASADMAALIAQPLVYFDEPDAQKAVDTYMSRQAAKLMRDKRASGRGLND
jgi:hypothetical protein